MSNGYFPDFSLALSLKTDFFTLWCFLHGILHDSALSNSFYADKNFSFVLLFRGSLAVAGLYQQRKDVSKRRYPDGIAVSARPMDESRQAFHGSNRPENRFTNFISVLAIKLSAAGRKDVFASDFRRGGLPREKLPANLWFMEVGILNASVAGLRTCLLAVTALRAGRGVLFSLRG